MERAAGAEVVDPSCPAPAHSPTKAAWDRGCRCKGAVGAYDLWKVRRKVAVDAALDAEGNCVARSHDTYNAYVHHGCRHPEACARYEAKLQRQRMMRAAERAADPGRDPRERWRGSHMRVSELTLLFLLEGVLRGTATRGEYIAAIAAMDARLNRFGRPVFEGGEIAARLHITADDVRRYRRYRLRARSERTMRRLADAQWRAKRRG